MRLVRDADPLVRAFLAEFSVAEVAGLALAATAALVEETNALLGPAPAPQHALGLGRRPLRPEDFGVLPIRR